MLRLSSALPLLVALFITGCQSLPEYRETSTDTIDLRDSNNGLSKIAVEMVETMSTNKRVQQVIRIEQPVIFIDNLANKTSRHVDTAPIVEAMSQTISAQGHFQPISGSNFAGDYQTHSGRVDPSKAIRFGRRIGAQFLLYGQLSSLTIPNSNNDDFFQLTLRLLDLETGLIEWSGQKELKQR